MQIEYFFKGINGQQVRKIMELLTVNKIPARWMPGKMKDTTFQSIYILSEKKSFTKKQIELIPVIINSFCFGAEITCYGMDDIL